MISAPNYESYWIRTILTNPINHEKSDYPLNSKVDSAIALLIRLYLVFPTKNRSALPRELIDPVYELNCDSKWCNSAVRTSRGKNRRISSSL